MQAASWALEAWEFVRQVRAVEESQLELLWSGLVALAQELDLAC